MKNKKYETILKEELITALGCTEPIAIAYASSIAKKHIKLDAHKLDFFNVRCSVNVIKNANSVNVPMSKGKKGILYAAALGYVGGNSELQLEVLSTVNDEHIREAKRLIEQGVIEVSCLDTPKKLDIVIECGNKSEKVSVRISDNHSNLTYVKVNDKVLLDKSNECEEDEQDDCMTLDDIYDFAINGDITEVKEIVKKQAIYNKRICEEGQKGKIGIGISNYISNIFGNNISSKMVYITAAGSEARMGGCDLPVVINSGSGNQGITVSIPLYVYSELNNIGEDKMCRALVLSNLVAIYQKKRIGKLSPFCGVVNASAGAAAGLSYLKGGCKEDSFKAMEYVLGTMSGLICDGAKNSCSSKIAMCINSAVIASEISLDKKGYYAGDGIVKDSPQKTVEGIFKIATDGMEKMDDVVVNIMLNN